MDRFPFVSLLKAYLNAKSAVLDGPTLDVRRRNLQRVFQILLGLRHDRLIDTLDPRKFAKKEVDALVSWTNTKSTGYSAKLWTAIEDFLLYNDNDVVNRLEAKSLWRRPDPAYAPGPVKDEDWLRDALSKLDSLDGWRAEAASA